MHGSSGERPWAPSAVEHTLAKQITAQSLVFTPGSENVHTKAGSSFTRGTCGVIVGVGKAPWWPGLVWGFPLWAGMRAELQLILYDFVRWPVQEPGVAYGEREFLVGLCSSKPRDRAGRCLDLGLSALWPLLRSLGLGVPPKEKQEPSPRGGETEGRHTQLSHPLPVVLPTEPRF